MEALCAYKMSVNINQPTKNNIPLDFTHHYPCCDKLKSQINSGLKDAKPGATDNHPYFT
jgi:hypothetical protein